MTKKYISSLSMILLLLFSALLTGAGQDSKTNAGASCEASRQRQIPISLTDKEGRFVENLRAEDLNLRENDVPLIISKLELKTDQLMSVVILLDASVSQDRTLVHTQLAAEKFVEWVLKTKNDRAALVSFSGEATVEEDLTNDSRKLLTAIYRVKIDHPPDYLLGGIATGRTPPIQPRRQGMTAMWDAAWASTDEILNPVVNSRRVILLLTDGEDNMSSSRWRETIEHVAVNDVTVFSIGLSDKKYFDLVGEYNLKDLSEQTGGRVFFLKKVQDLPGIFSKIEQQIRSHYLLSYCTANPKPAAPLKIKVELKNPRLRQADLRLAYRRWGL